VFELQFADSDDTTLAMSVDDFAATVKRLVQLFPNAKLVKGSIFPRYYFLRFKSVSFLVFEVVFPIFFRLFLTFIPLFTEKSPPFSSSFFS
jgi:hypothetical protein